MAQMTTMIHPLMTLSKLYFLPTEQQLAPWQVAGVDNTDTIAPSVLELHILWEAWRLASGDRAECGLFSRMCALYSIPYVERKPVWSDMNP